jgi:hypothetical protein
MVIDAVVPCGDGSRLAIKNLVFERKGALRRAGTTASCLG